jgi:hypothetical protein
MVGNLDVRSQGYLRIAETIRKGGVRSTAEKRGDDVEQPISTVSLAVECHAMVEWDQKAALAEYHRSKQRTEGGRTRENQSLTGWIMPEAQLR